MSNSRIDLTSVEARLQAVLPNSIYCGTSYDKDFMEKFNKTFPAAWVIGQRMRPKDDGRGFSQVMRQHTEVEMIIRIVIRKLPTLDDNDARLSSLHFAVTDALIGWKPAQASRPFVWSLAQDGPPHEGVITSDLIFKCEVVYKKVITVDEDIP